MNTFKLHQPSSNSNLWDQQNRIAKIGYGHPSLRETNLSFNINYIF